MNSFSNYGLLFTRIFFFVESKAEPDFTKCDMFLDQHLC